MIAEILGSNEKSLFFRLEKKDRVFLKTTSGDLYFGTIIDNPPKKTPKHPWAWLQRKVEWDKVSNHLPVKIQMVNTCSLNYIEPVPTNVQVYDAVWEAMHVKMINVSLIELNS